ncbi:MAG TPA: sn-glycerol-3-phosphate ABC transporter ATP-binding protein UgpC [Alphaproteobacteria bacterium]|nr:sn-glycerol-3-phosphate ABC transporter ATP-binding protein UgpC [Alphaproteobacteria bacterium]
MASVSLRKVVKKYGELQVVHGVDLEIADDEFIVFVGPSGCGKSTLLRMIAGLESISGGEIVIDGTVVNDVPPRGRDIAMVFQDYALYPHMSVRENMGFGLKMRGFAAPEIARRIDNAAKILQIEHLLERRPRALSGGQRQRVAMGRAIVRDPKVFLFDEPLSNLDAKLRTEIRTEIKRLHQKLKTTLIYVTHDQVEAMTLADRIVVLRAGVIEQVGTPDQIYNHPESQFVADFTGSPPMNFIPGRLGGDGAVDIGNGRLPLPPALATAAAQYGAGEVVVGVRPEHIARAKGTAGPGLARLSLPVSVIEPLGSDTLAFLGLGGGREIIGRFTPEEAPKAGETVEIDVPAARLHLFDPKTGRALRAR